MPLTDFLLARLSDEVNATHGRPQLEQVPPSCWGPDRVRAECEVRKRLIWLHDRHRYSGNDGDWCYACHSDKCRVLIALALPYANHPDYQQEWKP